MTRVIVVIRDVGNLKVDYALPFDLPEVPRVGSYISIHRPDKPSPYGEDVVVRHVWWRLEHPETRPVVTGGDEKVGRLLEIFVECDPALGPYASDHWRDSMEAAQGRGINIEEFEVARVSVRERDLKPKT